MTTVARTHVRLTGRTVSLAGLTSTARGTMFDLLSTFFTGVTPDTFDADLSAKSHVILLEDDENVLRGFSTLLVYRTGVAGVDAVVVYSGDTIVHRDSWGSPALPLSWLAAVRGLTSGAGVRDVFWLLLTSGFRTYRFLPVFWREFYPRVDSTSVPKSLVDALARERFGDLYDEADGIVRFARPQVLVPELLDVASGRCRDEHIAFFLKRNPGFTKGDELVCLTSIGDANLTAAGRRIARTLGAPSIGAPP
jgi:hypothetical protein